MTGKKEIEFVVKVTVSETLGKEHVDELAAELTACAAKLKYTYKGAEVRPWTALKTNDLLFLWNEVQLAGDVMRTIDPGQVFGSMTCSEAQWLANIFAAAGDQKTHDFIMESHAWGDDDEDDEHHAKYLELEEGGGSF